MLWLLFFICLSILIAMLNIYIYDLSVCTCVYMCMYVYRGFLFCQTYLYIHAYILKAPVSHHFIIKTFLNWNLSNLSFSFGTTNKHFWQNKYRNGHQNDILNFRISLKFTKLIWQICAKKILSSQMGVKLSPVSCSYVMSYQ